MGRPSSQSDWGDGLFVCWLTSEPCWIKPDLPFELAALCVILMQQNAKFDVLEVKIAVRRHSKWDYFLKLCVLFFILISSPPLPGPLQLHSAASTSPGWSIQTADLSVILVRQSPPLQPLQGSVSPGRWEFCDALEFPSEDKVWPGKNRLLAML